LRDPRYQLANRGLGDIVDLFAIHSSGRRSAIKMTQTTLLFDPSLAFGFWCQQYLNIYQQLIKTKRKSTTQNWTKVNPGTTTTVTTMSGTSKHMAAAMATVASGVAIQGILGFGCSLVWMSFFLLFTTIPDAVGVLRPLAIGLNTLIFSQLWQHSNL
jgi:hypothetical protein